MILEIKVPVVGESINEVIIARWNKKPGEFVEMDELICELDSDKATFELNAEKAGVFKSNLKEGDTVRIGEYLGEIDTESPRPAGKTVEIKKTAKAKSPGPVEEVKSNEKNFPGPAAAKILAEKNIEPSEVKGTGREGRILKADALLAIASIKKNISKDRNERRAKMSSLRKTVSRRLVAAKNETAMLTTFNEADMSAIQSIRNRHKAAFKEAYGVNLGFMSFFTKAVCIALGEFPSVNAYIDGDEMIFHEYCDISIAVSAPKGLVVPVIRNAESLSFWEIETAVANLASKARENKLTLEEMTGGTFTITNGGVFGSMMSTPIINPPQSAILGMHNITERPVARDGQVVIRPMMYLALSYDHRIIDGRESVGFLVKVKECLEDPIRMLAAGQNPEKLLLEL